MTNTKHTQGPWFHYGKDLIGAKDAGAPICRLMTANQETEANAKLITAAPDLLETLKMVQEKLPRIDYQSRFEVMEDIRAAIAKASGE